jgi:hypothetical protein
MSELTFVITLPSHIAKASKSDTAIHCWKFNHDQSRADYQLFYPSQIEQATDFLITPFPSLEWNLILTE